LWLYGAQGEELHRDAIIPLLATQREERIHAGSSTEDFSFGQDPQIRRTLQQSVLKGADRVEMKKTKNKTHRRLLVGPSPREFADEKNAAVMVFPLPAS